MANENIISPPGYKFQIRPNTVDAGYRNKIKVVFENNEAPIKDFRDEVIDEEYITKILEIFRRLREEV